MIARIVTVDDRVEAEGRAARSKGRDELGPQRGSRSMRDPLVPSHPGAPRASGASGMVVDARHDAAGRARRDLGVLGDLAVRFSSWRFAAELSTWWMWPQHAAPRRARPAATLQPHAHHGVLRRAGDSRRCAP
jgi:hypothetical protein